MGNNIWTDEVLALSQKVIDIQDRLTASLALAIHQGIDNQNYGLVIRLLNIIDYEAHLLEIATQDLIYLLPRRKGRPPKWFERAEDILYFALQTQRCLDQIRQEVPGNYWKLIGTRLTKTYGTCRKQQRELLNILPQEHVIEADSAGPMARLIDTLEMGQSTDNGWRRRKN